MIRYRPGGAKDAAVQDRPEPREPPDWPLARDSGPVRAGIVSAGAQISARREHWCGHNPETRCQFDDPVRKALRLRERVHVSARSRRAALFGSGDMQDRRAELDGLRTVAIVIVALYHYAVFWAPAGRGDPILPYGDSLAWIPVGSL